MLRIGSHQQTGYVAQQLVVAGCEFTPAGDDPSEYVIDPWPFGEDAVTLVYEGRLLEGTFTDEETMRDAIGRAPWLVLATRLWPA